MVRRTNNPSQLVTSQPLPSTKPAAMPKLFRPVLMLLGLFLGYFIFTAMSYLIRMSFGIAAGFVLEPAGGLRRPAKASALPIGVIIPSDVFA